MPALNVADLVSRYTAGESEKQLASALGVSRSAIRSRLVAAGVLIRTRSEAELVKWSRMIGTERNRQVAAAHTARRGQKDSLEVQMKRAATWEAKMSHRGPAEIALTDSLAAGGVELTPQKAVGPYNLDLALSGSPVAVEVECGNVFRGRSLPKTMRRLRYIVDAGWRVLIVYTKNRPLTFPEITHAVWMFQAVVGVSRPAEGEIGVVDGTGRPVSVPGCDFADFIRFARF